jgi:hypothetical protein
MSEHGLSVATEPPSWCDCKPCVLERAYDLAVAAGAGPKRPRYTVRELLECRSMQSFVPSLHDCDRSRQWWEHFDAFFAPWLREEVEAGRIRDLDAAKYGASSLVSAPVVRSWGHFPGGKPAFTFDAIDGHELLFEGLYFGLTEDLDARTAIYAMRSFADYLGRHGAIAEETATHIRLEIRCWTERFLDHLGGGPYYLSNGRAVRFDD